MNLKVYLGDSVYADFDGHAIVLTTENGEGPSNTIVMEPEVLDALNRYIHALKRRIAGPANEAETALDRKA